MHSAFADQAFSALEGKAIFQNPLLRDAPGQQLRLILFFLNLAQGVFRRILQAFFTPPWIQHLECSPDFVQRKACDFVQGVRIILRRVCDLGKVRVRLLLQGCFFQGDSMFCQNAFLL